ncbi:neutral/alkaline non-lysosomal ceramidase N-terminal domain-containing protein [Larkinella soli]|uniref:neutral/alkaline non-lysosomal ceramidase N-terminal domain-containing protein n=1 Tax=Larkinella soli TaxID=1770527 RepID=UPI000FFC7EC7|nr:neutral/alkaline non-lysosomal ceramidase N-terminal domain-containing protein [Larkinella soli]
MEAHDFRAGAAQIDITPPPGTLINGDFITHYARFIHDSLYARALVLQRGDTTVAIVIVDICAMPKDLLDEVKVRIQSQTGLLPQNVLIAATHTHAAGSVASLLLGAADLPYRQKLPGLLVESVRAALQTLRPARIGFGAVDVPEHVVCRRFFMKEGYQAQNPVTGGLDGVKTNPFGDEQQIDRRVAPVDPQVSFLAVKGLDDRWISLLANYSLHYVGDWENGTITADYFGVFSAEIGRLLGADSGFVGMMSNGTSGEANIWDFLDPDRYPKEHFAKSELIGKDIAAKVFDALKTVAWQADPALSAEYAEVAAGVRKPTGEELEAARRLVADTQYKAIQQVDMDVLRRIYAREQVLLNEYPDTNLFPVQALQIGEGRIGALGGEFFAETGLRLKQNRSAYFTITMANGYIGYVPPAHEIERGGYETWRCRTSFLEPGAEETIREKLTELLKTGVESPVHQPG